MIEIPGPKDFKMLRKKAGLAQWQVAKKAGVSQSLIARIESGAIDTRLSTARRILSILNVEKTK